ncbi:MAG: DUF58 domain-containing protein [Planctomycetota bacterium]|jgi:uncharacterized protein (DUF58 family)
MSRIAFSAQFLKKLELLAVASRRMFAGRLRGERRSPRRGSSVEFADFRDYSQGDDYRYIDWHAFARFEDLFLKLFIEEEDLSVFILLDRSKSMDFGEPRKIDFAAQIAAALGYTALANLDRVTIRAFSDAGVRRTQALHGRSRVFRLLEFLETVDCEGGTNLNYTVDEFISSGRRRGVVIVLSDFFTAEGYEHALNRLKFSGFDPVAIQVLSPDEADPPVGGDWRLVDAETQGLVDISLGARAVRIYKSRLNAFTEALSEFCRTRGIPFVRTVTSEKFEDLMLRTFRRAAVLK